MDKLLWVSLPLLMAAATVVLLWWRGRLPSRQVLNMGFSLMLLAYVLVTAGLGIFWVANQHLPVFDWHYLFGYALLVLLAVHLAFNLRQVWWHLRRSPPLAAGPANRGRRPLLGAFGVVGATLVGGIGYFVGLRHGRTELRIDAARPATEDLALAVVEQFHDFSAHTRRGLLRRAPGADWGDAPPPFKASGGGQILALPVARKRATAALRTLMPAALADMLWHSAGVSARSGGIHFRTSPSSGALFATELYVVARSIEGVAAGLWRYDVPAHALEQIASGPVDGQALGLGALPGDTRGLVIASAVLRRSGYKYRDRSYRYILCDLGHALENLRVVAQASGQTATLIQAFDEARMAAALSLEQGTEAVLAVLLLQGDAATALPALVAGAWRPAALAGGAGGAGGAGAAGATLGITDAIHRATSLRAQSLPPLGYTAPRSASPVLPGGLLALPAAPAPAVDILAVIARRRSVRRYGSQPVALADLAAVLAAMTGPGALLSDALRIDLVAMRVQGLDEAAWRYHPQQHALELRARHGDGLRSRARAAGLNQDVIGNAAVVLVLAIDRAAFAADPAGAARGYRHAFIEAGLMGERVYLEAIPRGLGVCAVGAFYDDEAAVLVGSDPAREWIVHFAALGPLA